MATCLPWWEHTFTLKPPNTRGTGCSLEGPQTSPCCNGDKDSGRNVTMIEAVWSPFDGPLAQSHSTIEKSRFRRLYGSIALLVSQKELPTDHQKSKKKRCCGSKTIRKDHPHGHMSVLMAVLSEKQKFHANTFHLLQSGLDREHNHIRKLFSQDRQISTTI